MFWNKRVPPPTPSAEQDQSPPNGAIGRDLAQREAFNAFATGLDSTGATKKFSEICLGFSAQEQGRDASIKWRKSQFERALSQAMSETLQGSNLLSESFKDSPAFRKAVSESAHDLAAFLAHQSGPDSTAAAKRNAEQSFVVNNKEVKEVFDTFGKMFYYSGAQINVRGAPQSRLSLVTEALMEIVSDIIENRSAGDTSQLKYKELLKQLDINKQVEWARW